MFAVHLEIIAEIGKIMITPFCGKKHDRSLLLWSASDFWGLCGCIFLPFSLDLDLAEYINRQIRRLRRDLPGKHYNTKSHRVCRVQKFSHDEISWFEIKQVRGKSISSRQKENHSSDEFNVESNECGLNSSLQWFSCYWRVRLSPMRVACVAGATLSTLGLPVPGAKYYKILHMPVTEKRLTHFLFSVTVLTLCCFLRFLGLKWKFTGDRYKLSSPLFHAPRTRVSFRKLLSRDFSRLPKMESLLAGYQIL